LLFGVERVCNSGEKVKDDDDEKMLRERERREYDGQR